MNNNSNNTVETIGNLEFELKTSYYIKIISYLSFIFELFISFKVFLFIEKNIAFSTKG